MDIIREGRGGWSGCSTSQLSFWWISRTWSLKVQISWTIFMWPLRILWTRHDFQATWARVWCQGKNYPLYYSNDIKGFQDLQAGKFGKRPRPAVPLFTMSWWIFDGRAWFVSRQSVSLMRQEGFDKIGLVIISFKWRWDHVRELVLFETSIVSVVDYNLPISGEGEEHGHGAGGLLQNRSPQKLVLILTSIITNIVWKVVLLIRLVILNT